MSYIGSSAAPLPVAFAGVNGQSFNGGTNTFTLSRSVGKTTDIELVINNVQQNPWDGSYSVNGATLTTAETVSAGVANVYVGYRDAPLGSFAPLDGTVTPAKLSTGGPTWDAAGVVSSTRGFNFNTGSSSAIGVVTNKAALYALSADGTTYGYGISTNDVGGLDIMANQGGQPIRFWCGTSNASPTHQATLAANGNLQLLNGNLVLPSGKGIDFSANSNAAGASSELLDDYETGTWTPTMYSGGTMGAVLYATYVKVGRLVTINCYFTCTPTNNSNRFEIGGVPFVNNGASSCYVAGTIGYTGSLNAANWHGPTLTAGSTTFYFHYNNSTGTVPNSAFGGAANEIIVSITYHTGS